MSDGQRSKYSPTPGNPQQLRDAASEILVVLQSKLDALNDGSEETRRIAHELQMVIEEVRRALTEGTQG